MSAERWRDVSRIYHAALERDRAARPAFVLEACAGDDDLQREIESLLACAPAAEGILTAPALDVAARAMADDQEVTTRVGLRHGRYEIVARLGAGGMGDVYRARDLTLRRDVAIKMLPPMFSTDPQYRARFEREARLLATLNHPNIAAIYGIEESQDVQALVLELVEGETLADRIARGPVPVDEALPVARQIAEALEAAHEQGIIHRDLKPANVALRSDGTVKVLDFGLAKVLEPAAVTGGRAGAASSTTTAAQTMTQVGMILGTPAYMSPEQAEGRQADKRSDVWAFGTVLYEMLSGQRTFKGEGASDTRAAVSRQDIDWAALPASTPAAVRRLIARCLERDVRRRLRDIGEARIVLDDPEATVPGDAGGAPAPALARAPARPLWRRALPAALSAILAGVLAGLTAWSLKPSPPLVVTRLPFVLPAGQTFSGNSRRMVDISPDGARIVYAANNQLFLRSLSELDATAIQGTEGHQTASTPVFSPDGRSIAFFASGDQTIKRVAVGGGAPFTICPALSPTGMSWGAHGILFGQNTKGIMRVSPNGGLPELLVPLTEETAHGPLILPDGQHVLFSILSGEAWEKARIVVQSLTSGERKTLIEVGGSEVRYVPTGHLVYAQGGSVLAVAFDVRRLEVKGAPVPIVQGVRRATAGVNGAANFSFSDTGSLVYIPGPALTSGLQEIALTDRQGRVDPLKLPPGSYRWPRVSRDGRRIVFVTDDGPEAIVWTYDLSGVRGKQRLTFGGNNRFPIWTADSQRVVFQSDREGDRAIFWQSADGGTAERLTKPNQGEAHEPESWFPKADRLLFSVRKGTDESLFTLSVPDRTVTPFGDVHSSTPTGAVVSPDGRWVAYASTERGTLTIYVQPFPATGAKYQLVASGSDKPHHPLWSPDGKELFYNPRPVAFESVSITTQPTFAFGNPVALPKPFATGPPGVRTQYDITPGGKFVGLITSGQSGSGTPPPDQIGVVFNWFEDLSARVPPAK